MPPRFGSSAPPPRPAISALALGARLASFGPAVEDARRLVAGDPAALGGVLIRQGQHGYLVARLEFGAGRDAVGHHNIALPGRRLHIGVPPVPFRERIRHAPLQHDSLQADGVE